MHLNVNDWLIWLFDLSYEQYQSKWKTSAALKWTKKLIQSKSKV